MRAQLEITESMDIRTRQGLLNALVGKVGKRMDNLLIPLELLCCLSRAEFSNKKAYIRWQKRQLNMLEEGLKNHPVVGFGEMGRKVNELRNIMRQIEESELCILVAGALGGRFDHEVGNINVLYRFSNIRIVLLSEDCLIYLLPRTHSHEIFILPSVEGPHCGLIPAGAPAASTTTTGLKWNLNDTAMSVGGLISTSNIAVEEKITLTIAGIKFAAMYSPLHSFKKIKSLMSFRQDPNCLALLMDGSAAL